MTFEDSQKILENLLKEYDYDVFAVTNLIIDKSNQHLIETDNCILPSEAIRWSMTGEEPDNIEYRVKKHKELKRPKTTLMKKLLDNVEDEEIVQCVKESYELSIESGFLYFIYNNIEEGKKPRVRILTRMIWYGIDT